MFWNFLKNNSDININWQKKEKKKKEEEKKIISEEKKRIGKAELAKQIAEDLWMSRKKASAIIDFLEIKIFDFLLDWYEVKFWWLWRFKIIYRKKRKWRDPSTWKEIELPWQFEIKFKQSKTYKNILNSEWIIKKLMKIKNLNKNWDS